MVSARSSASLSRERAGAGQRVFSYGCPHPAESRGEHSKAELALDPATQARLDRGYRMTELLKQGLHEPMHVTDQVLIIYAGTRGHLDKVPMEEVRQWQLQFLDFVHKQKRELWQRITDSHDLDDESRSALEAAIQEFQQIRERKTPLRQPEAQTATV